uniref:DUF1308 domain-containing protein n=2 Tax=Macrostomum lignano TaxID=282301 RepID=A0A1I8JD93_9PLAT
SIAEATEVIQPSAIKPTGSVAVDQPRLRESQLARRVLDQLDFVDSVCDKLLGSIPGVDRLQRRCQTERRFVLSLLQDSATETDLERRVEQLRSSNAGQLSAVAQQLDLLTSGSTQQQSGHGTLAASSPKSCCAVLEKFAVFSRNSEDCLEATASDGQRSISALPSCTAKVEVDLVCHGGSLWLKCVARNPRGLSQASSGQTSHGAGRGLLQQARLLMRAAALAGPAPGAIRLRIHCASGVTPRLRDRLLAVGVSEVTGQLAEGDEDEFDDEHDDVHDEELETGINGAGSIEHPLAHPATANLDVTCLVALSSSLCRGSGRFQQFLERPLALTAELERNEPCLPPLKSFLLSSGRRLIACQTAVTEFRSILETVAGPTEIRRAEKWLSRVEQVPDQCPPDLCNRLRLSRSVQARHLAIFGTGAALGAITVTSNAKFVRAAGKQGLHFCVHLHSCRPLTEAKEGQVADAASDKTD